MNVCVYDNPSTMSREAWRDGVLIAKISAKLMYTKGFDGFQGMPFMLNCGREFESGKIRGDADAMKIKDAQ
jgi:hypothetical protein